MSAGSLSVRADNEILMGMHYATSASIANAGGVMKLSLQDLGTFVVIESGAILRGIQIVDEDQNDRTLDWPGYGRALVIVASPADPWSVTVRHDDGTVSEHLRLYCPSSSVLGTYAHGVLTENHILPVRDPTLNRWRFPWCAP